MKKYHFYVTPAFTDGWLVCERGRGNHFMVRFPTKYRAQIVANFLWKYWKNKHPCLQKLKFFVSKYCCDWNCLKDFMKVFEV